MQDKSIWIALPTSERSRQLIAQWCALCAVSFDFEQIGRRAGGPDGALDGGPIAVKLRRTESEIQFNANLPAGSALTANRRTRSSIRPVA